MKYIGLLSFGNGWMELWCFLLFFALASAVGERLESRVDDECAALGPKDCICD